MDNISTLPGAERFYRYLCSLFPGQDVVVLPPVVGDRSYGIEFSKSYEVQVDGRTVGTYATFGPRPREKKVVREYRGEIPGYVNEAIVISNRYVPAGDKKPENFVTLVYGDSYYEAALWDSPNPHGMIVKTPWQRQDGHETLEQFP